MNSYLARAAASSLLAVLIVSGCGHDEERRFPEAPPLRLLSEKDVSDWLAVSYDLAGGGNPELAGKFRSFEELGIYLGKRPHEAKDLCTTHRVDPADYAEISRAIHVARGIQIGREREAARAPAVIPMPELPPGAPSVPAVEWAPPADPEAQSAARERPLPAVSQKNLDTYLEHRSDIEEMIRLFRFAEGETP